MTETEESGGSLGLPGYTESPVRSQSESGKTNTKKRARKSGSESDSNSPPARHKLHCAGVGGSRVGSGRPAEERTTSESNSSDPDYETYLAFMKFYEDKKKQGTSISKDVVDDITALHSWVSSPTKGIVMGPRAKAALGHNRYNLLNCINDDNSIKTQASEILRDDSDDESMNDSIEDVEAHKILSNPDPVISLPCPAPPRSRRERSPMIMNATKETIDFYTTNDKNMSLSITSKTFNVCSILNKLLNTVSTVELDSVEMQCTRNKVGFELKIKQLSRLNYSKVSVITKGSDKVHLQSNSTAYVKKRFAVHWAAENLLSNIIEGEGVKLNKMMEEKSNKCTKCNEKNIKKRCSFCTGEVCESCFSKSANACRECPPFKMEIIGSIAEDELVKAGIKRLSTKKMVNKDAELDKLTPRKKKGKEPSMLKKKLPGLTIKEILERQTPKKSPDTKGTKKSPKQVSKLTPDKEKESINVKGQDEVKEPDKSCVPTKKPKTIPKPQLEKKELKEVLKSLTAPWRLGPDMPSDGSCLTHSFVWLCQEYDLKEFKNKDFSEWRKYICDNKERLLRERNKFNAYFDDYNQFKEQNEESRKSSEWLGAVEVECFSQAVQRDILIFHPWSHRGTPFERITADVENDFRSKAPLALGLQNGNHYRPLVPTGPEAGVKAYICNRLDLMGVTLDDPMKPQANMTGGWRNAYNEGPQIEKMRDLLNNTDVESLDKVKYDTLVSSLKALVAQLSYQQHLNTNFRKLQEKYVTQLQDKLKENGISIKANDTDPTSIKLLSLEQKLDMVIRKLGNDVNMDLMEEQEPLQNIHQKEDHQLFGNSAPDNTISVDYFNFLISTMSERLDICLCYFRLSVCNRKLKQCFCCAHCKQKKGYDSCHKGLSSYQDPKKKHDDIYYSIAVSKEDRKDPEFPKTVNNSILINSSGRKGTDEIRIDEVVGMADQGHGECMMTGFLSDIRSKSSKKFLRVHKRQPKIQGIEAALAGSSGKPMRSKSVDEAGGLFEAGGDDHHGKVNTCPVGFFEKLNTVTKIMKLIDPKYSHYSQKVLATLRMMARNSLVTIRDMRELEESCRQVLGIDMETMMQRLQTEIKKMKKAKKLEGNSDWGCEAWDLSRGWSGGQLIDLDNPITLIDQESRSRVIKSSKDADTCGNKKTRNLPKKQLNNFNNKLNSQKLSTNTEIMKLIKTDHNKDVYNHTEGFNEVILGDKDQLDQIDELIEVVDPSRAKNRGVLTLLGWNLENYERKLPVLRELCEIYNPDVINCQETWMNNSKGLELKSAIKGFTMTSQSKDKYIKNKDELSRFRNYHGVATIMNDKLSKKASVIETDSDRILFHKVKIEEKTILLLNCYLPTRGTSMEELRAFERCLNRISALVLEHSSNNTSFILFSDWNLCPIRHNKDKKRIKAMTNFLSSMDARYYVPETPSFTPNLGQSSWLDGIIMSKDLELSFLITLDEEYFPNSTSTHSPVLAEVRYEKIRNKEPRGKRVKKEDSPFHDYKRVNWQNVHLEMYQKISEQLVEYSMSALEDAEWDVKTKVFSDCLAKAAHMATMEDIKSVEERHNERNVRREELLIAKVMIMKELRTYRQNIKKRWRLEMKEAKVEHPGHKDIIRYQELENEKKRVTYKLRRIEREIQREKEKTRLNALNEDLPRGDSKNFFKIMSKYKGESGNEYPDKLIVDGKAFVGDQVLEGFHAMAYAQSRKEKMTDTDVPSEFITIKKFNEVYENVIDMDEFETRKLADYDIMKELRKIKDNKAPDLSNLMKENITRNSKSIQKKFCEIINGMISDPANYCSSLCSTSVASFLYKGKGKNRQDPTSYRKISIGSLFNKVVDKIFSHETQEVAKENQPPTQYGFTEGVNFLLCTLLRESIIRKAVSQGKNPVLLACDVKNAFSKTSRPCQMYELFNAGERSKVWKYSLATYSNTWTVIKQGKKYSDLIEEMCGSKQGGVKSAVDYKSYNSPLYRLIEWSGLGLKVDKKKFGSVIVADDALSISNTIPEMQGIVSLYEYFAEIYSVEYCVKKTVVNRFGTMEAKKELEESSLSIMGVKPLFDKESVHLGLWISEALKDVAEINVDSRIKKTEGKLFGYLRNIIWDKSGMASVEVKLNLYKTLLRPSLLSGLNALCIRKSTLAKLVEWENWILRKILKLKKNASMTGIHATCGLLPIEGHLHKGVLSLWYNLWCNEENPAMEVVMSTLKEKAEDGFWGAHLRDICTRYRIPDPETMRKKKAPSKPSWKKYVDKKILDLHKDIIITKKENMSTLSLMSEEIKLDERVMRAIDSSKGGSKRTIDSVISMLLGEFRNYEWRKRNGYAISDLCPFCKNGTDNIIHNLLKCEKINEDDVVKSRRDLLAATWRETHFTAADSTHAARKILNPDLEYRAGHNSVVNKLFEQSRALVQAVVYRYEQLLHDVVQGPVHVDKSSQPDQSSEYKLEGNDDSDNQRITDFFKPIQKLDTPGTQERPRKSNAPMNADDVNLTASDQAVVSILNPGNSLVIGMLTTRHGRIPIWREVIDGSEATAGYWKEGGKLEGKRETWSGVVNLVSDDLDLLLCARSVLSCAFNMKNACKESIKLNLFEILHSNKISQLSACRLWPKEMMRELEKTWNIKPWPKGGKLLLGEEGESAPCSVYTLFIKDAPPLDVMCLGESGNISEVFIHRQNLPWALTITRNDMVKIDDSRNLLSGPPRYQDFMADMERMDPMCLTRSFPRDSCSTSQVEIMLDAWLANTGNSLTPIRSDLECPMVRVEGSLMLKRQPTYFEWNSKETPSRFARISTVRPWFKVVDAEPVRPDTQVIYEKELKCIENEIVVDLERAKHDETILSGNLEGVQSHFKQRQNVRTSSTQIPCKRVVEIRTEEEFQDWKRRERALHDALKEHKEELRKFKFVPTSPIERKFVIKEENDDEEETDDARVTLEEEHKRVVRIKREDESFSEEKEIKKRKRSSSRSPAGEKKKVKVEPTEGSPRYSDPSPSPEYSNIKSPKYSNIKSPNYSNVKSPRYSGPPSSPKDTTSSSDSDTDSDNDTSTDFTNPTECINLFKDIRKTNGKIPHEVVRVLKRLQCKHVLRKKKNEAKLKKKLHKICQLAKEKAKEEEKAKLMKEEKKDKKRKEEKKKAKKAPKVKQEVKEERRELDWKKVRVIKEPVAAPKKEKEPTPDPLNASADLSDYIDDIEQALNDTIEEDEKKLAEMSKGSGNHGQQADDEDYELQLHISESEVIDGNIKFVVERNLTRSSRSATRAGQRPVLALPLCRFKTIPGNDFMTLLSKFLLVMGFSITLYNYRIPLPKRLLPSVRLSSTQMTPSTTTSYPIYSRNRGKASIVYIYFI